jgi:hypothetical protein
MPAKTANSNKSKGKKLVSKNRFSRLELGIFVLIFAVVGAVVLWISFAAPTAPNVYLTPSTTVAGTNTTFTMQLRENSGTTPVNFVEATFTFPTTIIGCVSVDGTGSSFSTVPQNGTVCSTGSGSVSVDRGTAAVAGNSVTGDQLIATITFTTKSTGGTANFAFTNATKLYNATTDVDILGGTANTTGTSFTVDTTPPTVNITSPTSGASLSGATSTPITISVSASDASSAVKKVEFYDGASLLGSDTSSPYSFSWNVSGTGTLGSHSLTAKAYDTFNNVATSSTVNVTLADKTAPSIPGAFKSTGSDLTSISLSWTASTDNIGVANYKLSRNGSLISTLGSSSLTYTDTGLANTTSYTYSIVAIDAAGNASAAATVSAQTSTPIPGDLDDNGHVDSADLAIMIVNYGTTFSGADIDGNGVVDGHDFAILLTHYGQ